MDSKLNSETLRRIQAALESASAILSRFTPGDIETEYKRDTIR